MQLEITEDEKQMLLHCINTTIKTAANAMLAASELLPLAAKIEAATEPKEGK